MRPILDDRQRREVRLIDRGMGRNDRLVYEPPRGTELAVDERTSIPGYPDQYATITLFESDQSLDDGKSIEYSRHSLVVTSGRAAYEVFVGKFRREPWAPYLGRVFGSVDSPYISQLIREYDDRMDSGEAPGPLNPTSLINRDRSGLVTRNQHPFVQALYSAIEEFLQPHLDRIRAESETGGSSPVNEATRRRNRNLSNLLGRLLQEEELQSGGDDGSGGRLPPIGLSLIPTTRIVEPSQPGSVTARYRPDPNTLPVDLPPVVAVSISDDDGRVREFPLELRERTGYYSSSLSAGIREDGDISEVTVSFSGQEASCIVEWAHRDTPPIAGLEFENNSYTLKEGTDRVIRLLVPWDLVSQFEPIPELQISGDPSISIVRNTGLVGTDERRDCAICTVTVKGRGVGSTAQLRARIGDSEASTALTVSASGVGGPRVRYEELTIPQRAYLSEDGSTLVINAANPSISRYLGEKRDGWPGQGDIHFRTMLAEVITYTLARYVIQNRPQQESPDMMFRLFVAHMELMERWLPRVHRVLVPTNEITVAA